MPDLKERSWRMRLAPMRWMQRSISGLLMRLGQCILTRRYDLVLGSTSLFPSDPPGMPPDSPASCWERAPSTFWLLLSDGACGGCDVWFPVGRLGVATLLAAAAEEADMAAVKAAEEVVVVVVVVSAEAAAVAAAAAAGAVGALLLGGEEEEVLLALLAWVERFVSMSIGWRSSSASLSLILR